MTDLYLYNTLTHKKELFVPIDPSNVRMYVCGPTVYDNPHIGNARSAVVFDVLHRLLGHLYKNVTYVRNVTDIDDKIMDAAKANNESISNLTYRVEKQYESDMEALNVLRPNIAPHATDHVPHMIGMINRLITNGHAYITEGHVLFDTTSYHGLGKLSGRVADDLIAGKRVTVETYKKNPADFVLWKPAEVGDDKSSVFNSPWGDGRPGWHIECSAMSTEYLGHNFDIHGGGADLMFPHHENEIAQSTCAYQGSTYANYWVHNGFLTVDGKKMSKSDGNFITVRDLLSKGIRPEVIRFVLLKTKYNEPLDWSDKLLIDAKTELDNLYRKVTEENSEIPINFYTELADDLNTPKTISLLYKMSGENLKIAGNILGILQQDPEVWFKGNPSTTELASIYAKIVLRSFHKIHKQFDEADKLRKELLDQGIVLEDTPDGKTDWRRV